MRPRVSRPTHGHTPEGMTRRAFLTASMALAATAGVEFVGGQAPAFAQTRTLHVLEWSSFVPAADVVTDQQAAEFGKQAGVKVTIEHVNANDLPARATAAIEGRKGPDILQLLNNAPHLYAGGLEDHNQLIAELGGDKFYSFILDAVKADGVARGVPYFFGGGANTYRKDIFQKVGIDKLPDTWAEHLAAGKKLKKYGMPIGQTLGHTFGDAPSFAYPLLWSFGGVEVDDKGKVALNSKETLAAAEFVKESWFAACDQRGLAPNDSSNNRPFLAETIGCTSNGASIYFVVRNKPEKAVPGLADQIGHFLLPRGPAGRFHTVGTFSNCITTYSENKDVAKDYIRFCHQKEAFEKFFVTNKGYINGSL